MLHLHNCKKKNNGKVWQAEVENAKDTQHHNHQLSRCVLNVWINLRGMSPLFCLIASIGCAHPSRQGVNREKRENSSSNVELMHTKGGNLWIYPLICQTQLWFRLFWHGAPYVWKTLKCFSDYYEKCAQIPYIRWLLQSLKSWWSIRLKTDQNLAPHMSKFWKDNLFHSVHRNREAQQIKMIKRTRFS